MFDSLFAKKYWRSSETSFCKAWTKKRITQRCKRRAHKCSNTRQATCSLIISKRICSSSKSIAGNPENSGILLERRASTTDSSHFSTVMYSLFAEKTEKSLQYIEQRIWSNKTILAKFTSSDSNSTAVEAFGSYFCKSGKNVFTVSSCLVPLIYHIFCRPRR